MQPDNNILAKVLEIIDYDQDKEAVTRDFLDLCEKRTLFNMVSKLPEEETEKLFTKVSQTEDLQAKAQLFKEFLSPDDYKKEFAEVAAAIFKEYMEALLPSLSDKQKESLNVYLNSLLTEGDTVVLPSK